MTAYARVRAGLLALLLGHTLFTGAADARASGISYAIPSNFIRALVKKQAAASNQERNTP